MSPKLESLEGLVFLSGFGYTFGANPYASAAPAYDSTAAAPDAGYTYRIGEVNAYNGSSTYSYYGNQDAGYTSRIGEVDPFSGNSYYRYYGDTGVFTGYSTQTPNSYSYTPTPSWFQDLQSSGGYQIGTSSPYTGNSFTNYYDNSGTSSAWYSYDNSYNNNDNSGYDSGNYSNNATGDSSYSSGYSWNDSSTLTFDEYAY